MVAMKATAGEIAKNFGQYADRALVEPVSITKYGREHLVLLSADEYARLKRRDRQVYRTGDLPDELVEAIRIAEPPFESGAFNHEYDPKSGT
jgi:Antitoxin Phd_YefM, type II toxin-antitoxin system